MRVLHILNELRPSGAEEMLRIAGPYWRSLGCDLQILCIARHAGDFAGLLAEAGWTIHCTGLCGNPIALWRALRQALTEIQPDVLHIHPEGYGVLPPLVGWHCGIPMARTVHNSFGFEGGLRLRKTIERWFARKLGVRFVAIGESVLENERDRFHNPCLLLWNWIDTRHFRPPSPEERVTARKHLQLPDDKIILVSVGNGSDVKNYKVIVEAVAKLADPRLLYCQVGHPHPEGTDESLSRELGVDSQVRFCGPSSDVLQWLWAADVFVMPSIYEGFGLAAVEALAAGCTCVFADCPGLKDFKELGVMATWVEPRASSFTDQIRNLIESPTSGKSKTAGALKVREFFSSDLRAHAYFELWQSLHAHSPGGMFSAH